MTQLKLAVSEVVSMVLRGLCNRELDRFTHSSCLPLSFNATVLALQESKSALGKGSLQKLTPEESRKARITTLHDLFNVTNVEELWDS